MTNKKWKFKVGAHFICKNEEPVIDRMLTSMKGMWDVAVMCDTGSTDKTIEIAETHGCIIEHFNWIDDFGAARNYSLQKLYEHCPDVDAIMWADLDDVIMSPDDVIKFRELIDQFMEQPQYDCINMPYIYSHDKSCVGNEGIANFRYYRLRVFKRNSGCYWKCRVHEYIESNPEKHLNIDTVTFHHYRDETKGTINTARNRRILQKVWEEASEAEKPRYTFYLAKEFTYAGMYDEAIEKFKSYLPIANWMPEKIRSLYELGECYYHKKDFEEATKWAFEAIRADNRYAEPYILLCRMAYDKQDWNMAIAWASIIPFLGKPTTMFFDYLPSHTYLPYDYMQAAYHYLGNNDKARECLDKCMSYKPHERRYLNNWSIFHDEVEKIGIIIPTLNRKERLTNCLKHIKENAFVKNYEIFIGVDGNEEYFKELNEELKEETNVTVILFGSEYDSKDVHEDGTDDRVDPVTVNRVGVPTIVEDLVDQAKLSGCKYVTYLGDDTEPLAGFLVYAWKACEGKNLVAYNDKVWNGQIACHWFAPIDLRDKLGGFFFYKGYNHTGCDNELTDKANKKGLYAFADKAYVDHIHYIKNICSDKNKVAEEDDCYKIAWDGDKVRRDRELLKLRESNNYIADTTEIKINIGSGHANREGFITLDKYEKADIKADIFEEGLFKDNSIDYILSEHVLEHFSSDDGKKFAKICYSALKSGGKLEISVPDIGKIDQVTDQNYRLKVLYGWREHGEGMFHLFGYNILTLQELLKTQGFKVESLVEEYTYDAPSLRIIVIK